MQIELTGTNVEITDTLRTLVGRRLDKVGRQVSELAVCEVILSQERNPSIKASQKAEAILVLKGATLNAKSSAVEMSAALTEVAADLAAPGRQAARQARRQAARRRPLDPSSRGRRRRAGRRRDLGGTGRAGPAPSLSCGPWVCWTKR